MKWITPLLFFALLLVSDGRPAIADGPSPMDMRGMGGGRRMSLNLVSPADSPTQIRRGRLMIYADNTGMGLMGGSATASAPPRLRILLGLYSVVDASGPVSLKGNHLIVEGILSTAAGSSPVSIDLSFDIIGGVAVLAYEIPLAQFDGRATVLLQKVEVRDPADALFAAPGAQVTVPSPMPTPMHTPVATPGQMCHQDVDCNDGDGDTTDVCTSMGCRNVPNHMGTPGMMH